MLNGYRRGVSTGALVAQNQPTLDGTDTEVRALAGVVYQWCFQHGWAHMGSVQEFAPGFVTGFRLTKLGKTISVARQLA